MKRAIPICVVSLLIYDIYTNGLSTNQLHCGWNGQSIIKLFYQNYILKRRSQHYDGPIGGKRFES